MRPYVVAGLQSVSLPFQSPLKSDYCSRKDQTLSKGQMNLKVTLLEEGKNNNNEGAVGLACTPMTARQAKYLGGNRQKQSVCGKAHYFQQNGPLRRSLKLDAFQRISSGEPTAQCPSHLIRATPALFKYQMKCCTMGLLWRAQTKLTLLFLEFFFFFCIWRACFYILNPLYLLNLPNLHRLPIPPPPPPRGLTSTP